MRRFITECAGYLSVAGCAVPKVAGAPLAPVERAWEVPTLELYSRVVAEDGGVLGPEGRHEPR